MSRFKDRLAELGQVHCFDYKTALRQSGNTQEGVDATVIRGIEAFLQNLSGKAPGAAPLVAR